jgi:hypothetical protein
MGRDLGEPVPGGPVVGVGEHGVDALDDDGDLVTAPSASARTCAIHHAQLHSALSPPLGRLVVRLTVGAEPGRRPRVHHHQPAPVGLNRGGSPSPNTWFYASLGVREVIVIDPATRAAEVYRLAGATDVAVSADERGRVHAESIDVRFSTAAGKLRVEHDVDRADL